MLTPIRAFSEIVKLQSSRRFVSRSIGDHPPDVVNLGEDSEGRGGGGAEEADDEDDPAGAGEAGHGVGVQGAADRQEPLAGEGEDRQHRHVPAGTQIMLMMCKMSLICKYCCKI